MYRLRSHHIRHPKCQLLDYSKVEVVASAGGSFWLTWVGDPHLAQLTMSIIPTSYPVNLNTLPIVIP